MLVCNHVAALLLFLLVCVFVPLVDRGVIHHYADTMLLSAHQQWPPGVPACIYTYTGVGWCGVTTIRIDFVRVKRCARCLFLSAGSGDRDLMLHRA